jgi:hypothetical protein
MIRHPQLQPPPAMAEAFMVSIDALVACISEVDATYTDADANDFKYISALFNKARGVAWRGVAWRGVAWRGVAWRG